MLRSHFLKTLLFTASRFHKLCCLPGSKVCKSYGTKSCAWILFMMGKSKVTSSSSKLVTIHLLIIKKHFLSAVSPPEFLTSILWFR
jgi:hypothetical protein